MKAQNGGQNKGKFEQRECQGRSQKRCCGELSKQQAALLLERSPETRFLPKAALQPINEILH